MEIGKKNLMRVIDRLDFGMILDGGDDKRILLPNRYVPEGSNVGDELEVFIYFDSDDRPIATNLTPYAQVGDFAYLTVKSVNQVGAFLDWGLMKDLLVPFGEQKVNMKEGSSYVVYVHVDDKSGRIVGSAKVHKFIGNTLPQYERGQEVDLLVLEEIDEGYRVIVNNAHWGLIYRDQVFTPIEKGDSLKGYVREVREDDKLDINLMPLGYNKVDALKENILKVLKANDGFAPVNDKTDAELIYYLFGCSKKAFKMSIGGLFKEKIITIADDGIRLIEK